jgi:prepilin-type N-terminal cleavage/methylation domain-containing protein
MKTHSARNAPHKGFSLFEMLIFVSILGIMITFAIPLFGNTEGARQVTNQRNAQTFCTLASAASAAGIKVTQGTTDVETVLKRLIDGVTVTRGGLKGRTFRLPAVGSNEVQGASQYIEIKDGELVYNPKL